METVHRAVDTRLGRPIRIKFLRAIQRQIRTGSTATITRAKRRSICPSSPQLLVSVQPTLSDRIGRNASPDISQTDKVFDRFRWPEALNFRLVNSDQRERQLGARTFVDGRVNFKDKCMADRFSSVVIPRKRSVVGSEPEPSVA